MISVKLLNLIWGSYKLMPNMFFLRKTNLYIGVPPKMQLFLLPYANVDHYITNMTNVE